MKNAATYEKKIAKLLKDLKGPRPSEASAEDDSTAVLIESILEADTTDKLAQSAMQAIQQEYVDYNELRVSPSKDIVDCIGREFPNAWTKAQIIRTVLNNIFHRAYSLNLDYMASMSKRDLRGHLEEFGLDPYAAACVVLRVFGGHAVPVDGTLVEVLKMSGCVDPDTDRDDVQGFLTRIVSHKDALSAHLRLRQHVAASAKALARKRKQEEAARAKAEAEVRAKAQAEEKAKKAQEKKAEKAARQEAAHTAKAARKDLKTGKTVKAAGKSSGKATAAKKGGKPKTVGPTDKKAAGKK